jgi:hypothetical protein
METVMHVRSAIFALTALALASIAAADPAKAPVGRSAQPTSHSPVVLASAERVVGSVPPADVRSEQTKHPHARVTTCRCGDVQPQAEEQEQQ